VIDNPGMREVQLWADEDDLQDIFDDIEILAQKCRFRNCQHNAEPGCAVKDSLDKGLLDKKRLKSYIKMKSELKELAQKQKGN
jgi:ribosome biogenesis GTPase